MAVSRRSSRRSFLAQSAAAAVMGTLSSSAGRAGAAEPDAQAEDFGVMVRGRSFWGHALAPSTAGDGWSLYILFRDHVVRRGPWSVHEVNLQSEKVSAHYGTENEPSQLFAFPDGRIYVPVGAAFFRLNPGLKPEAQASGAQQPALAGASGYGAASKTFDQIPLPCADYWFWRPGRDGVIYLCGSAQRRAVRFDPATSTVEDYGAVGHEQGAMLARMWEYGDVTAEGEILNPLAVDASCLYVVTGQLPRALWAVDLRTRQQRLLMCVVDPDRMNLAQRGEACYAVVQRPAGREVYRLSGAGVVGADSLPAQPAQTRPVLAGVPRPDVAPGIPLAVPDYHGTGLCEGNGTATVHYRPAGGAWRSVTFDLGDFPSYLFHLGSTADGRLFVSTDDPYTIFTFDVNTRRAEILGPSPYYTHVYGFVEARGKVYFAGYTGAPLFEYDPTRRWTYQPPHPDRETPLPEDAHANPRLVARIPCMRRAYDVVLGADGRLYLPCSAEMTGPMAAGGGLGWYDPRTGQCGLIREGFAFHRGHSAATACDGRFIVVATTSWWQRKIDPESSGVPDRIVTYDVEAGKVTGDVVPTERTARGGEVVEWQRGKIVGRLSARAPCGPEAVFFVLDLAAQRVESSFRLPGTSECRLLRLPDGRLLGYHDGGLYRLDPATWRFEPIARLKVAPRDWRIVNGQVFALLDTHLVRLTNVG